MTIPVCPKCDSAHIRRRNPEKAQSPAEGAETYKCDVCQSLFDDPEEREPKREQKLRGLPALLERMDAEAFEQLT